MKDSVQSTQGSFSFDDLVGDIDGYLIGSLANDNINRPIDDVVREVRANIAANPTWRYSAFYSQRFSSNWSTAKAAAVDVFTSGNLFVDGAVTYFIGGSPMFVIESQYNGGGGLEPTAAELQGLSEAWANLIAGLASSGASAAPTP